MLIMISTSWWGIYSLLVWTTVSAENSTVEPLPTAEEWKQAPSCPLWGPMETFYKQGIQKGRYLGRWWLQDKYNELADLGGKCWSQTYSVDYVNKTIYRDNDYRTTIGSFPRTETGLVTIADIRDSNLLTFTPEESFLSSSPDEYRVLATDYETFTIEYSCKDTNLIRRNEKIWIYTREKKAPRSVLKRAYKSLKVLGLSGWKLKKADQSCKEVEEPARRTFEVTSSTTSTTSAPLLRLAPPPISTGQLTSKMLGSGLQLAQKVFVPWTLHPQLGKGLGGGRPRVGQRRSGGRVKSPLRRDVLQRNRKNFLINTRRKPKRTRRFRV